MANGLITIHPPLRLLVGVWLLQSWRRLCSVAQQSRLLVGLITIFIAGYCAIAFFLFYRGLGSAGLPLSMSASGDRITAASADVPIRDLYILRVENGQAASFDFKQGATTRVFKKVPTP